MKERSRGRSPYDGIVLPKSAFTLMELLVVLVILGLLGGAVTVIPWGRSSPAREADRALRWMLRALTKANRTGRSFALGTGFGVSEGTLQLCWGHSGDTEAFPASSGFRFRLVRHGMFAPESVYSPQWGTFTPAATIRIASERSTETHYLILSGYGRVRTAAAPPPGNVE